MMKQTLVEQAKALAAKRSRYGKRTAEDIDLAIAWVKGEVGLKEVREAKAIEVDGSAASYLFLAVALKQAVSEGKLKPV